jgi:hypothetical protein
MGNQIKNALDPSGLKTCGTGSDIGFDGRYWNAVTCDQHHLESRGFSNIVSTVSQKPCCKDGQKSFEMSAYANALYEIVFTQNQVFLPPPSSGISLSKYIQLASHEYGHEYINDMINGKTVTSQISATGCGLKELSENLKKAANSALEATSSRVLSDIVDIHNSYHSRVGNGGSEDRSISYQNVNNATRGW